MYFSGEGKDKQLGINIPLHQSEQKQQQQRQEEEKKLSPFTKRILLVDDDPDITLTFKKAFEEANRISGNRISFHVITYNDPLQVFYRY